MSPRWIMFFVSAFVLGQLMAAFYSGYAMDVGGVLGAFMTQQMSSSDNWLQAFVNSVPALNVAVAFLVALWRILWWDYPFLNTGMNAWILWGLLRPFSIGVVFGLIRLFRGGTS
jgi:hypothetical protein